MSSFIPAAIWGIIILVISGIPGTAFPKVPTFLEWMSPDKIIHLFVYAILGFLLQLGFVKKYYSKRKSFIIILYSFIFGTIFGIITEVLQFYLFIGRNGNVYDFAANVLGCLIGIFIYNLIFLKKNDKKHIKNKNN